MTPHSPTRAIRSVAAVAGRSACILLALPMLVAASAADPAPHDVITASKFELFVTDAVESARFYEALGFRVVQRKPDGYTTLTNGPALIALSPIPWWLPLHWLGFLRHPPLGTEIVLYTEELEALRSALGEAGYDPGAIERQPWGDRDFRVTDRDGYYVRVSEGRALPGCPEQEPMP